MVAIGASVLYQWNLVATALISFTNENGLSLASDKYVFFFVDSNAVLGEDEHGAVIYSLPHIHQ